MRLKLLSPIILLILAVSIKVNANEDDFLDFDSDEGVVESKNSDNFDEFEGNSNSGPVDTNSNNNDDIDDFDFSNDDDEDEDGMVEDDEDFDASEDKENAIPVEKSDFDFGDEVIVDVEGNVKGNRNEGGNKKRSFTEKQRKGHGAPKMVEVPSHLRENWYQYWIEGGFLALIVYYMLNYFKGKQVNDRIANLWMQENLEFLKTQFVEVGGAQVDNPDDTPTINFNSSNNYTIWCTGRKGCEGMLVELKLVARQDLITVWKNRFNRKRTEGIDFINLSYYFEDDALTEPCIISLGQPRLVNELWRNFNDLKTFCPKGPKEKADINPKFNGCAENIEMITNLFDAKAKNTFAYPANNDYPILKLGYLHLSDKYESMYVDQEENAEKKEKELREKVFVTSLIVDPDQIDEQGCLGSEAFTKGILYIADKAKRLKLSKEAKSACEKRRQKAIADEQKKQHTLRTEKAAERAELRRRELNKKIMDQEDPVKAQKMHEEMMAKDARKSNRKFKTKMK